MTFAEIRDRIEALVKIGGWSNAIPGPDYALLANEGLRLFTRETQHNVEDVSITTVIAQPTYALLQGSPVDTRDWISLFDDALWGGSPLPLGNAWLSQTTRDQLRISNRLWRQTGTGTPQWWYWSAANQVGLYPVPAIAGVAVSFEGVRHEPRLSLDSSIPLANEDFHEGICLFGAWHWGKLYSRGEERSVAKEYYTEALSYTLRYKESLNSQEAALVQRRVSRPQQEYMNLGSKQSPVWWP